MKDKIFKKLVKRSSYASTGILVARFSAAIAGIVLARAIGADQFGVYATVWALVNLSASFTNIGITSGLVRDGARSPLSLPILLGNTILVKVTIGVSALIIAYFSRSLVTNNVKVPMLFLPLALAVFSTICVEPFFAVLYVKGKQKIVALFEIGRGVIFLFGFLVLASGKFDLASFAWFQGLLYLAALLIVCIFVISKVSISINLSSLRKQVTCSLVFGISSIVYSVYSQLSILLLSHFCLEKEVGYFAVALRFVTIIFVIGAGIKNNVFLPLLFNLYETNREKFRSVCNFMQKCFIPLGIFAAAALYVCSDALIMILLGEEYRQSVGILRILCWTIALHFGVIPIDAAFTTANKMWTKIALQICVTFIGVIIGLVAIRNYGSIGAIFTELTISLSLMLLFVPFGYRENLIEMSGIKRIILPVGISLGFSILITEILPQAYFQRPSLFFIVSLLVLGPTVLKISRDYSLGLELERKIR